MTETENTDIFPFKTEELTNEIQKKFKLSLQCNKLTHVKIKYIKN